jgi:hypothetical protein
MLLAKWREEHNSEWMHKCEVCEDVEELRALINQFSSDGVDWALASQLFKVEKGQTAPNSSGMSGCKPVPKSSLKAIKSEAVIVNTQSRDSAVAKPVVVSREMPKEEKHAALMSTSKSMGKARANEKQRDRGENQKGEGPASSAPAATAGRAAGASEKSFAAEHDIPQQKQHTHVPMLLVSGSTRQRTLLHYLRITCALLRCHGREARVAVPQGPMDVRHPQRRRVGGRGRGRGRGGKDSGPKEVFFLFLQEG